jgi:NDP-sugar pyrophosphorylase family protein
VLDGCIGEGSVIMDGCRIGRESSIGHSVLGPGCRIGSRVVLLDHHPGGESVRMGVKGSIMDSGRKRLGSVLGDGCIVEDGSVLPPGTLLDPRSLVAGSLR